MRLNNFYILIPMGYMRLGIFLLSTSADQKKAHLHFPLDSRPLLFESHLSVVEDTFSCTCHPSYMVIQDLLCRTVHAPCFEERFSEVSYLFADSVFRLTYFHQFDLDLVLEFTKFKCERVGGLYVAIQSNKPSN